MKSKKQRYKEIMNKRKPNQGSSNGNGPMWFIVFIALFAILLSIYTVWNEGILGKGDLSIGIGNVVNPEIERIR